MILRFITSFVGTERSHTAKSLWNTLLKKHNYNYCKLICQFLDMYLDLVIRNQLQCRQIDSDRVGERTSM